VPSIVPSVVPLPILINVSNREYYNSKDLQAFKPEFYYGCTSKPRNIITKKEIPEYEYIYATFEKLTKKWNLSNDACKKAQLLISKQWVDANYFKSSSIVIKKKIVLAQQKQGQQEEKQRQQEELPQITTLPPPKYELEALNTDEEEEIVEEANGEQQQKVENAPPLLHLDDGEKFHDADENVIEIETRGERHEDKIYFKVKDVSVGFGMPNLDKALMHKEKGYTRNVDYKIMFNRSAVTNGHHQTIKKCLFLTYGGMLHVLFGSRNKNATLFRKWATNKLFTIQMGTREQKVKLGAEILNTSPRTLKAIFDKHAANFPSIYLMSLGKVRELRETFRICENIPDDSIVYKFGFTDDLARRVIELEAEYSKLPGVTVTTGVFQIIDTKYTSEAESEVRETFTAWDARMKTPQGYNELVALDEKQFANIKKLYRRIGEEFAGATRGLQNQIIELKDGIKEHENVIARLKITIQHKDELHEKEVQWYKKDGELKDMVIENLKLKYQIATTATVKNGGTITC
jgi:Arc/MetJ-type ribon-helix-helix transcriptional regulator